MKPVIIHEDDCPVEDWSAEGRSNVTWKTLISGDRTPTNSITMGIAELQPEGATKQLHLHRHQPAEAYYVLAGKGYVSIDGEETALTAGSAVFVPSNALHAVGNSSKTTLKLLYVFGVDSFEDVHYIFPN